MLGLHSPMTTRSSWPHRRNNETRTQDLHRSSRVCFQMSRLVIWGAGGWPAAVTGSHARLGEGGSQPLCNDRDVHCGLESDGEFVIPGRQRAVAFQSADAALHGMPGLVVLGVERWRPAPAATPFLAVAG